MGCPSTSIKITVSSDQTIWIIKNTLPTKLITAYCLFSQLREDESEMCVYCIF